MHLYTPNPFFMQKLHYTGTKPHLSKPFSKQFSPMTNCKQSGLTFEGTERVQSGASYFISCVTWPTSCHQGSSMTEFSCATFWYDWALARLHVCRVNALVKGLINVIFPLPSKSTFASLLFSSHTHIKTRPFVSCRKTVTQAHIV